MVSLVCSDRCWCDSYIVRVIVVVVLSVLVGVNC